MARSLPATDRPRQAPRSRFWPRVFKAVSAVSLTMAPVAALSLWLLMSDAELAAAVMERGDLLPVFTALAKVIGKAFVAVMAAL
jgi:hypothetical protein